MAQGWLTLFWHTVVLYATGKGWNEVEHFHVLSKQFITYLILLTDYFLKVAFFICNTLSEMIHKISENWRNSPWFMIAVLSHIARFSSFSVCVCACMRACVRERERERDICTYTFFQLSPHSMKSGTIRFGEHTGYGCALRRSLTYYILHQSISWTGFEMLWHRLFLGVQTVPSVPLPTEEVHSEICQSALRHTVYQYVCSVSPFLHPRSGL